MSSRRLLIVAVVGLLSSAAQAQTKWYVDADCPGPGDGSEADPYCSIQTAIDIAVDTDEIVVAPGTYFERIDFLGKAVTLRSSDGPEVTIIDDSTPGTTAVTCESGEGPDTMLDGFTITGVDLFVDSGGGMSNVSSSPTVTNCVFSGNSAVSRGGGMYNVKSNPTVIGCSFVANSTVSGPGGPGEGTGGGMYNEDSNPTVIDCTFNENGAPYGGGMYNTGSSPTVTGCTFSGNGAGDGGGMLNTSNSSPTVADCTFDGNSASGPFSFGHGGGMYNISSNPTLNNCTFSGNFASQTGGGMSNTGASPTVTGCTFSGNEAGQGGGMANFGSNPTVTGCTFSGNTAPVEGGGMYNTNNSNPTVTNCTFTGNGAEGGGGISISDSNATVTNCTFSGNSADIDGGGISLSNSNATVTSCTFSDNDADTGGGGTGMGGGIDLGPFSSAAVTDCTFSGNSAGGIALLGSSSTVINCAFAVNSRYGIVNNQSSLTVANCTFSGNGSPYGGGGVVNVAGNSMVNNSILWGNIPDDIVDEEGGVTVVHYSDLEGGWPGIGNIDADPMFVDPDNGDLRLSPGSPCIDAGDNTGVPDGILRDLDGNPRFVVGKTMFQPTAGPRVDMGAYEYQPGSPVEGLLRIMYGSDAAVVARHFGPCP